MEWRPRCDGLGRNLSSGRAVVTGLPAQRPNAVASGWVRPTCSRPQPLSARVHLIRPGPTGTARSCAGIVQDIALRCPTTCPTISSWLIVRSDRSHFPPTSPTRSTGPPPRKAPRSARGSPRPQRTVCGSMPAARVSRSGNASTVPSRPMSSSMGSPERGRWSAGSRHARAPE